MIRKDVLLRNAAQTLNTAGIEDPRREARLLLGWASGRDFSQLLGMDVVDDEAEARFEIALARRVAREPMAFITGETGFWTLDLEVSADTLIPRGDSEALIEALLEVKPDRNSVTSVLDLGTGTGCLLLAALSEYKAAFGIGVDLAPGAAALAARNAHRNGFAGRSSFFAGSWNSALNGRFDVVLSNPPYIETADVATLMPEVAVYEPARALDGGPDGLNAYRVICAALPNLLTKEGCAVLEMGIGQIDDVAAIGLEFGLVEVLRHRDLGGIPRALVLRSAQGGGK
ncbi:peptide chain release factor N(5)-glutamine methyltransferase [Gluconobacter wancherniae]|uniref:peptide chain release factor N(5)-glutamine methyltransferase n=1 Tax=Gluconobacter wancherniae TaxID=1307955 RepID=UPI001B8B0EF7|nr:peptide chain release factor N(5)-glutamine methyltransferase [Gluconobacter wancherniae]MBS1094078.1 peptide chain release factor N(5)-glutamine methyltransferase [Gluconobacter wancherniae]